MSTIKDAVSVYYGQEIQKTEDLKFDACCTSDYDSALTKNLTDEVLARRYGCGSPLAEALDGCTVLDLGCGAGADCYMAAQLVGPKGKVIGLDMTDEQLEVARRNIAAHMDRFGFEEPNVEFIKGHIEEIPLSDNSVDVVMSNCVINLSSEKQKVFQEIWRVLKPGGEFYIADIVADRRVPQRLQEDTVLWSECLTGAAYIEDLRRIMGNAGFKDTRVVSSRLLHDVIEGIRFESRIIRGFKVDQEDRCEDYGQVAVYRGTIAGKEQEFALDKDHVFVAGEAMRICENTANMLAQSRFAPHFLVSPPMQHLGLFNCTSTTTTPNVEQNTAETQSANCC